MAHLKTALGLSERRACSIVGADRKMIRNRSRQAPDMELRGRLRALANELRRFVYRRLFILLRREGEPSGHLSALTRKSADGSKAACPTPRRRHAGTVADCCAGKRQLVVGLCA
ncbi:Mobile element protein [Hyphomicrobium sulfonivorans]|uniref:Mobile element protein n=1 Tax=Hyphomicrobium sulfonivorans TaxID=121290 RepID=A0A109BMN6_HYPSL|nr:Mobile element protein [Hyphomicrobium sulfonivorans]